MRALAHTPIRHVLTSPTALALACAAALLALDAVALAGPPNVGDPAPQLKCRARDFVVNTPDYEVDFEALRGDIIVVIGVDCVRIDTAQFIRGISDFYPKYNPSTGVHIFMIEVYNKPAAEIERWAMMEQIRYPIATGLRKYEPYDVREGVPLAWIIDVTGIVKFNGDPRGAGFEAIIQREMRRCQYPGLGTHELHKDLKRAGKAWTNREYENARVEAMKVLEENPENTADAEVTALRAQAQLIIDRATALLSKLVDTAMSALDGGDYRAAVNAYQRIVDEFEDTAEAEAAEEALDELDTREIKAIIKAQNDIEIIWTATNPAVPAERTKALQQLRKIAADNEDNIAGRTAKTYIDVLENFQSD